MEKGRLERHSEEILRGGGMKERCIRCGKAAFLRIRNIGEKGYLQTIEALEARGMDVSHLK